MLERLKALLKALFYKHFDYDLVGEYYDDDGKGHYHKRYVRKYHLKKRGGKK